MNAGKSPSGKMIEPVPGRGGNSRAAKELAFQEKGLLPFLTRYWKIVVPLFIIGLSLFIWTLLQPKKGTAYFGVCNTFLEMQVRYPQTIKLTSVEWIERSLRIYFTHIDAYGENHSEMFECLFNAKGDLTLLEARRNRIALPSEKVKDFNKTIPIVLMAKPDLTLPDPLPDDLENLKKDLKPSKKDLKNQL